MEQDLEGALGVACRFLAKRDRTAAETRRRLARDGFDEVVVDRVLAALGDQGYLDDVRYAQRFVEDRRNLDEWGAGRIRNRLLACGVAPEVVDEAVAREPEAEREAAIALLRRRMPRLARETRERDRALGLLLRRGYEPELARDAVLAHARESAASHDPVTETCVRLRRDQASTTIN